MQEFTLHLANYLFYSFHTILTLFNLFEWLHRRTRKLNLNLNFLTYAAVPNSASSFYVRK